MVHWVTKAEAHIQVIITLGGMCSEVNSGAFIIQV